MIGLTVIYGAVSLAIYVDLWLFLIPSVRLEVCKLEINELGLNFAKDIATELITLSTALLVLSATFMKDTLKNLSKRKELFLKIAWSLLVFSILSGIYSLLIMAGNVLSADYPREPLVNESVREAARIQIVFFFVGYFALRGYICRGQSCEPHK